MKFIDEARIIVEAGSGGNGCLSFLREKYRAKGGPDGGDGGDGGSIFFQADDAVNTLVDYRYQPRYRVPSGASGRGKECTGASSDDLVLTVPVGTTIIDQDTLEVLGDLKSHGQKIIVAQGGFHGLGNARFKSSVNRTPRQTTLGGPGEKRSLKLELKVVADVGLLGLPNAGKSTFIRAVSAAKPKVADYPFTTLVPNLGVVSLERHRSFVIADIPGLIEGAAEGAGLGFQFLRHVSRTRLLLHIVDMAPFDMTNPADAVRSIEVELEKFSPTLAKRDRWLILNKLDLIPEDERRDRCQALLDELKWEGPVFEVASIDKTGTNAVCQAVMVFNEDKREQEDLDPEKAFQEQEIISKMEEEARLCIRAHYDEKMRIRQKNKDAKNDDDANNEDVDVHYV